MRSAAACRDELERRPQWPRVPRLALLEQMAAFYAGGREALERSGAVLVTGCRFNSALGRAASREGPVHSGGGCLRTVYAPLPMAVSMSPSSLRTAMAISRTTFETPASWEYDLTERTRPASSPERIWSRSCPAICRYMGSGLSRSTVIIRKSVGLPAGIHVSRYFPRGPYCTLGEFWLGFLGITGGRG